MVSKKGKKGAEVEHRLLQVENSEPKRYNIIPILSLGGKLELATSNRTAHLGAKQLQLRKGALPEGCGVLRECIE